MFDTDVLGSVLITAITGVMSCIAIKSHSQDVDDVFAIVYWVLLVLLHLFTWADTLRARRKTDEHRMSRKGKERRSTELPLADGGVTKVSCRPSTSL